MNNKAQKNFEVQGEKSGAIIINNNLRPEQYIQEEWNRWLVIFGNKKPLSYEHYLNFKAWEKGVYKFLKRQKYA